MTSEAPSSFLPTPTRPGGFFYASFGSYPRNDYTCREKRILVNDAGTALNRFRYDSAFQPGFEAGGSLLVQGSLVVGRYGCTVSTAPYDPEIESETAINQETDLEDWARQMGCWYDHPQDHYKEQGYQFYGFGGEAQVFAEGDLYVHKVCRTGQYDNLVRT